jgi:hypothetical protein
MFSAHYCAQISHEKVPSDDEGPRRYDLICAVTTDRALMAPLRPIADVLRSQKTLAKRAEIGQERKFQLRHNAPPTRLKSAVSRQIGWRAVVPVPS